MFLSAFLGVIPDSDLVPKRVSQTDWSKCSASCGTSGTMFRINDNKKETAACSRIPCQGERADS